MGAAVAALGVRDRCVPDRRPGWRAHPRTTAGPVDAGWFLVRQPNPHHQPDRADPQQPRTAGAGPVDPGAGDRTIRDAAPAWLTVSLSPCWRPVAGGGSVA